MREVTIQRILWNKFHDHLSIILSSRQTRGCTWVWWSSLLGLSICHF